MRALALLVLTLLTGCRAPLVRHEFARAAMGTEFRLVFYAPDAASAERAAAAAFTRIEALDAALSDYRAESELACLGRTSDGPCPTDWTLISHELALVLAEAEDVARASGGAFDVTVGPLVELWRRARRQGELPTAERLATARAAVGWRALELDRTRGAVRLLAPRMRLDLGGIAKGYALDAALAELADQGIERALIDGGGDLLAGAPPPGVRGWRVAISGLDSADPGADRAAAYFELAHAALATSGDLERSFELAGVRYSHILDPRSGLALTEQRLVSVLAPNGMSADAWATALSVLGPEGLALVAERAGFSARIVAASAAGLDVFGSGSFSAALSCATPARSGPGAQNP
ncbi:MAG: FAD:protein FMN transferase [Planctomycetota bacterium]